MNKEKKNNEIHCSSNTPVFSSVESIDPGRGLRHTIRGCNFPWLGVQRFSKTNIRRGRHVVRVARISTKGQRTAPRHIDDLSIPRPLLARLVLIKHEDERCAFMSAQLRPRSSRSRCVVSIIAPKKKQDRFIRGEKIYPRGRFAGAISSVIEVYVATCIPSLSLSLFQFLLVFW